MKSLHAFFSLAASFSACACLASAAPQAQEEPPASQTLFLSLCGSSAPKGLTLPSGSLLVPGVAESSDAKASQSSSGAVVFKEGWAKSSARFVFKLPENAAASGFYSIQTRFSMGGVAKQSFELLAGPDESSLSLRASFSQDNETSWSSLWREAAARALLLPSDRVVAVSESGPAGDRKIFEGFLLNQAVKLPPWPSPASAALRGTLLASGCDLKSAQRRIYVLDGGNPGELDAALAELLKAKDFLKGSRIDYLGGAAAGEMAARLPGSLPMIVVSNPGMRVQALLSKPSASNAAELVAKDGVLPLPKTQGRNPAWSAPRPLKNGVPEEWLLAGCWAGKSGASLWGIGTESQLRPLPDEPCEIVSFDHTEHSAWRAAKSSGDGTCVVEQATKDYTWPFGTAYACVYLDAPEACEGLFQIAQSGVQTGAWLDGEPLVFERSSWRSGALGSDEATDASGVTDQGNVLDVKLSRKEAPKAAKISLKKGCNRLLVKLVMQNKKGEPFLFNARFAGKDGRPLELKASVWSPEGAKLERKDLGRVVSRIDFDRVGAVASPGDPLKMTATFSYAAEPGPEGLPVPMLPLDCQIVAVLKDYDLKELARASAPVTLPGEASFDLGKAAGPGYYSVVLTAKAADGSPLVDFTPDGFSCLLGTKAQSERRASKKLASVHYFMSSENRHILGGDPGKTMDWMNRFGVYVNVGSNPGLSEELWKCAKAKGITLFMDFWDIHNTDKPEFKRALVENAAQYTRFFKSFNEVDIVPKTRMSSEKWFARTKLEYETVKAVKPDSVYVGGSLVRVGAATEREWFDGCLKLGIDKYLDAWDVHAYPQYAPLLGRSISNSPNETELGVLGAYKRLGRENKLPFILGETGARSCHGPDSRRWQAETVAKMIAWANSRKDFQLIAFLVPWSYERNVPGSRGDWDISFGQKPGEAAFYTAGALIDGFPYRWEETLDRNVQAAWFGPTLMLWRTDELKAPLSVSLGQGDWVKVDVVGRASKLELNGDFQATLETSQSPVYVLKREDYERLTAF